MSNPNWDDVPDVYTDGRSVVPHPDPHPEFTAEVWERWRADRAARRKAEAPDPDEDLDARSAYQDYHPPEIIQEAEEFDEPCSALASHLKIAMKNGWELVELAHAKSISKGKPYGSGAKAGQVRPTRNVDLQWLKVQKAGVGRALITYPVIDGKVYGTRVSRRFNGEMYSDADIKKILGGTYGNADA